MSATSVATFFRCCMAGRWSFSKTVKHIALGCPGWKHAWGVATINYPFLLLCTVALLRTGELCSLGRSSKSHSAYWVHSAEILVNSLKSSLNSEGEASYRCLEGLGNQKQPGSPGDGFSYGNYCQMSASLKPLHCSQLYINRANASQYQKIRAGKSSVGSVRPSLCQVYPWLLDEISLKYFQGRSNSPFFLQRGGFHIFILYSNRFSSPCYM